MAPARTAWSGFTAFLWGKVPRIGGSDHPQWKPAGSALLRFEQGCTGPAILDTVGLLYNPHYPNGLASPRSPNQRKFSEALMQRKNRLRHCWKHRVRSSVLHNTCWNNGPFHGALGLVHLLMAQQRPRRPRDLTARDCRTFDYRHLTPQVWTCTLQQVGTPTRGRFSGPGSVRD